MGPVRPGSIATRRFGAISAVVVLLATAMAAVAWSGGAAAAARLDGAPLQSRAGLSLAGLDSGYDNTCAIASDGRAECWGDGRGGLGTGPLPFGSANPRSQEVLTNSTALSGKTVEQVSAGGTASYRGACALTTDDVITCWGNHRANAGGADTDASLFEPLLVPVTGTPLQGRAIAEVTVGGNHACARTADGLVACWGSNLSGALGTNDAMHHDTPTAVATVGTGLAGKTVVDISAGTDHTCAVTSDGQVVCWGVRRFMGNGNSGGWTGEPTLLAKAGTGLAGKTVTSLSAGVGHSCAVATDGSAACWGDSLLGLGSTATVNTYRPLAVVTAGSALQGKTISQVSAGGNFSCALATDGTLACWGKGGEGQLGDGEAGGTGNHNVTAPVAVVRTGTPLAGSTVVAVAAGVNHACAAASNGVAACWGRNGLGQLGDGQTVTSDLARGVLPRLEAPTAPTGVSVQPGNGRATVRWSTPASAGLSSITGYDVVLYPVGLSPRSGSWSSPAPTATSTSGVVTMTNGHTYRARVRARNTTGTGRGTWSALSAPFTPKAFYTPFASTTALVRRLYLDIIGRAPTSVELNAWVRDLDTGVKTKGQLADSLRRSDENVTFVDPTARLYRAILGRAPDAGGLDYWIGRRRSGTWSLRRMADFFGSSAEFRAKYGTLTNRQFVARIYTDVLVRPASQADLDYWTAEIDTGRRTRGQVIVGFSESPEYKTKQREATDVSVAYILLMDRVPTAGETSAWVTAQRGGTSHVGLLQGLLDSAAYADHIT